MSRPALVRLAARGGRASVLESPLVGFLQRRRTNLDVGGAYEPVPDGVTGSAVKPHVAVPAWLNVDHVAIWVGSDPGKVCSVVTGLKAGHRPSSRVVDCY